MEAFLSQAWREKSFVLLMVEGVPGTKRRTPRRTETWWAREACPRITIPMTYFVQPTQMLALRPKDNSRNCPARAAHTRWSRRTTRSASGWPATSLRPSTISTGTTLRGSSNAPFRLGSYPSGNATRSLKSDAARTVTPEPHHESRAKGFPHRMGRVLARFDRNVETHRQARPFGTHLGNMTKGRSRRAAERKVYHATFGSLAWVRN